jgi:hypothetical protein
MGVKLEFKHKKKGILGAFLRRVCVLIFGGCINIRVGTEFFG